MKCDNNENEGNEEIQYEEEKLIISVMYEENESWND